MQVKGRPPATGCRPKKNWCYPENDEWVDVGVLGYPIRQTYIIYVYIYIIQIYMYSRWTMHKIIGSRLAGGSEIHHPRIPSQIGNHPSGMVMMPWFFLGKHRKDSKAPTSFMMFFMSIRFETSQHDPSWRQTAFRDPRSCRIGTSTHTCINFFRRYQHKKNVENLSIVKTIRN